MCVCYDNGRDPRRAPSNSVVFQRRLRIRPESETQRAVQLDGIGWSVQRWWPAKSCCWCASKAPSSRMIRWIVNYTEAYFVKHQVPMFSQPTVTTTIKPENLHSWVTICLYWQFRKHLIPTSPVYYTNTYENFAN